MGFFVMPLSPAYPKPEPSLSGFILNLAANILMDLNEPEPDFIDASSARALPATSRFTPP
jgi:hypothetical protein